MLNYAIYYISIFSPLLAICYGRGSRHVLLYYAYACFTADILNYVLKQAAISHASVSNIFLLTEFILVTLYYKNVFLGKKYIWQYIIVVSMIAIYYLTNAYGLLLNSTTDVQAYNYKDASWFYIAYIVLSLFGLYKVMKAVLLVPLEKSTLFLSSVAFLLYASGAFFLLLFKDNATAKDLNLYVGLWFYFFMPLNILKNILLAYTLKHVTRSI